MKLEKENVNLISNLSIDVEEKQRLRERMDKNDAKYDQNTTMSVVWSAILFIIFALIFWKLLSSLVLGAFCGAELGLMWFVITNMIIDTQSKKQWIEINDIYVSFKRIEDVISDIDDIKEALKTEHINITLTLDNTKSIDICFLAKGGEILIHTFYIDELRYKEIDTCNIQFIQDNKEMNQVLGYKVIVDLPLSMAPF